MGILTKSPSVPGDIELSKAMLIYYTVTSNVCLHHNQTFYLSLTDGNGEKHTNEHCVKHDYVLCVMVKTAQISDLNVHAILVSKIVACHQHQRELV